MNVGEILTGENVRYSALVGKEGWLYIWGVDNIEDKISGRLIASDEELSAFGLNVGRRATWSKSNGISYRHLIGPDKSSVYPEFLPPLISRSNLTLLEQCSTVWSHEAYGIDFIDAAHVLKRESLKHQVYFKSDSHWNYIGALAVFNEIARSLSATGVRIEPFSENEIDTTAKRRVFELGALGKEPKLEEFHFIKPKNIFSKLVFENNSAQGKIQVFENDNFTLPRCVLFRDSYSSFFIPFLAERCSRLTVLKANSFWYNLVEEEQPDVVLTQIAERFLLPQADDNHGRSFEDVFKVSMGPIVRAGNLSRARRAV